MVWPAGKAGLALVAILLLFATSAQAANQRVLVLKNGHVHARTEHWSCTDCWITHTRVGSSQRSASMAAVKKAPRGRATRQAIDQLLAAGAIDQPTRDQRQAQLRAVLRTYASLTGTRKNELGAVIDNSDAMAAAGALVPARLGPAFLTLQANAEWWSNGSFLKGGQRVSIDDSPVIWQYYPGQGIQLQMLANFGKANALWSGKRKQLLRQLIDALTPLAVDRGGFPAWEYYFKFGGGKPPWTSSISQGTAIQVLARSAALLNDPSLIGLGDAALGAFEQPAPTGVRVETENGPFYAIYSFNPNLRVLNAHAQALVGLYDFGQIAGDARAQALFQQGDATAQAILPSYDTGKWSMYDQNHESDLSYHNLVTGFLRNLCSRTGAQIYCDTAANFKADLKVAPTVTLAAQRIRAGKPAHLTFALDKISRVGLVVTNDAGTTVYSTSAVVGRGSRYYSWSRPAPPGLYKITARATDLAGNPSPQATATLRILPARKR